MNSKPDITAFENNRTVLFGNRKISTKPFSLIELIKLSKNQLLDNPEAPNFPKGYLPEIRYMNMNSTSDIFMNTISKTFDIDGSKCIRFILLNKKGRIYEELPQWTQILPNSYLARISCSYRNFDPNSMTLDYFVDMNEVQLNNENDFGGSNITVVNKEISAGFIIRDNTKIQIDDRISDFENHKQEVFIEFFKYDFGTVIKNLKLAD